MGNYDYLSALDEGNLRQNYRVVLLERTQAVYAEPVGSKRCRHVRPPALSDSIPGLGREADPIGRPLLPNSASTPLIRVSYCPIEPTRGYPRLSLWSRGRTVG